MTERLRVPVAVHLFLVRDDEILLLRRFNTGYEDGNYSVVAGHLDGGESVIDAAVREAHEEAGVEIAHGDAEVALVMHRFASDGERIDFFVTACGWSGEVTNQEPDKCDDLRWVDRRALPESVVPYVAAAVDAWLDGDHFTTFGRT